ncbi:hypothetical protein B0H21DRAFT_505985 [Amylocystis lapponica]|nr:hypothetical protein B0H21DRAFT_505985 [Amylocystis lapponica]
MSAVVCETRELNFGAPLEKDISNEHAFSKNRIAGSFKPTASPRLVATGRILHDPAPPPSEPHDESTPARTVYLWSAHSVGDAQHVRSSHARARSDTLPSSTTASLMGAAARRAYQRERASSTTERPRSRKSTYRPLVPSALSCAISLPTPDAAEGSFTPTGSPRHSLRSILAVDTSGTARSPGRAGGDLTCDTSVQSSSPDSPTVPSICRTPSSERDSDYFPTAPSSAGPVTPIHSADHSPRPFFESLHPVLESLEDESKFRVKTFCATCKKAGSNFPCCPRCGDKWCSRACRLQGGKKHVCTRGTAT